MDGIGDELPGKATYAHSRNAAGVRQGLREHLEAVASEAGHFAEPLGAADLARMLGHWHDLGKYNPLWQRYLLAAEAGDQAAGSGPDHKGAGSLVAFHALEPLALPIAGHHGGLPDLSDLRGRLEEWRRQGAEDTLKHVPTQLLEHPSLQPATHVNSPRAAEFFLRLLFSTLVDADFLDTERHFSPALGASRQAAPPLADLWAHFTAYHDGLPRRGGKVQRVRDAVYEACLQNANLPPGLFRLTVPTGGGKTLSAMAFALRHALAHGQRRVITAIPYTSITEQTADIYRAAFASERAVLEHHSGVAPEYLDRQTPLGLWARLAAQNWDAPVIVTTTVQLFESLFASSTSKCRKLHRIVGSVIILDEAQTLPPSLLAPILDALQTLADQYACSIVLCTATQPALDDAPGFTGLRRVHEIAPDPPALFAALRRVEYELPAPGASWSWLEAACAMLQERQALAITNTIADAQALFRALDDADALHLSTLLCGAHRRAVLAEVRRRLSSGTPCRLVSTQVVEAGVDVDFPLVLRAMGPLDRIVQAAGRCNREGRLARGRVIVFNPRDGKMPPGAYRTATDQARVELARPDADLHDPGLYHRYFRALLGKLDVDTERIQELRASLRFADVAARFRMIPDDTTEIVVRYDERARELVDAIREVSTPTREMVRAVQPYVVAVRTRNLDRYRRQGLLEELPAGLYGWVGAYDERLGLTEEHEVLIA